MAKYKAYPEYKDSGVEWLGKIPNHWALSKFRYNFSFGKGLTITKENLRDEGIPCVNYGEVHSKYGFEVDPRVHTLKCVDEKYLKDNASSLLFNGDIIFADTSEDLEGSGNFTQLISDTRTFAGYHTIIARPFRRGNTRFYAYLLDCQEVRTQVRTAVKGVKVFSVTQAILRNLSIWLPSEKEQQLIVKFLDHETAKIDNLIEKQKQLIELLKEKRQAVISHAVTKGLNPNVPMKDSGVEWLGEVPEHWGVKPLRYLGDCQNGINIGAEAFGSGYPFVSYGDAYKNRILPEIGSGLVQSTAEDRKKYSLLTGDILFTRTSETIEEIGFSSACLKTIENVCFAGFLIRFRPNSLDLNVEYSKYYFSNQLLRTFFTKEMNLITRASLSQDLLKTMPVVIPPRDEQKQIAELLDEKSKRFDQLQLLGEEQIKRLQERRTALISAAVTGKIDVRNWVAPEAKKAEVSQEATA
ncbi:restriction endonuclease subunit S [Serratia liquefaciens]|uniref:restriction endonuclease subunit S n=1 Tax=Serratia liquefaciens TaxID=614 RepID=UPI00218264D4|nr:restriction endonuclease subunit S [Serratia liquefaciens]CAI2500934.1 Type I restriction enzyme EcoKI specificity protein [Serratia liquefaciens]